MKVLFISHEASRTGAPLVLLSLLKSIKKEYPQIDIHLLLLKGGELMDEFEQSANIVKIHKKKNLWLKVKKKFLGAKQPYPLDLEQLKSNRYECIFANTIVSLPIAITLKNELHCPLILYVHEATSLLKTSGASLSNVYQCDKLIAASDIIKRAIASEYGIDPIKIAVVYPHTDNLPIELLPPSTRKPSNPFIVGLSGAGSWNKGVDILPYVIKECLEKHPDFNCHFVWVGDIPNDIRGDLLPYIKQHQLTITGVVNSPLEYFRQFNVYLLLSREESFSLTCAENILLGTPVVCMDGAIGILDLVGRDAMVVVPYMSIKDLAEAIYRLACDKKLYTSITNLAFSRISERYSKHIFVQSIANLILTCK